MELLFTRFGPQHTGSLNAGYILLAHFAGGGSCFLSDTWSAGGFSCIATRVLVSDTLAYNRETAGGEVPTFPFERSVSSLRLISSRDF